MLLLHSLLKMAHKIESWSFTHFMWKSCVMFSILHVLVICDHLHEDKFPVRKCHFQNLFVWGIHLYRYVLKFMCFGGLMFYFHDKNGVSWGVVFNLHNTTLLCCGASSLMFTLQNCCIWGLIFYLHDSKFLCWASYLYGTKLLHCGPSSFMFTIQNFCVGGPRLWCLRYKIVVFRASSVMVTIQNWCVGGSRLWCLH